MRLLDTHAYAWRRQGHPKLSEQSRSKIVAVSEDASSEECVVIMCSIQRLSKAA